MEMPKYDPAIAANVIAVLAIIIASLSYRLSRRTQSAQEDAKMPDVSINAGRLKTHPDWINLYIKATNHSPSEMEITSIKLPWRTKGMFWRTASKNGLAGEQNLLPAMPVDKATRTFGVGILLAPVGVGRDRHGSGGSTEWFTVYVSLPARSRSLSLSVLFHSRKSDVRRFKRIVSAHKISVPTKHTD